MNSFQEALISYHKHVIPILYIIIFFLVFPSFLCIAIDSRIFVSVGGIYKATGIIVYGFACFHTLKNFMFFLLYFFASFEKFQ